MSLDKWFLISNNKKENINNNLEDIIDNNIKNDVKILKVFTDGSCIGNGKKGSVGGYGIHFPNKEYKDISEKIDNPTNNKAELTAIKETINIVLENIKNNDIIEIYSDSEYSIKSLTEYAKTQSKKNWKNTKGKQIANYDLIKPTYEILCKYPKIKLKHIRAHTGKKDFESIANAKADELALNASIKQLKK